MKIRYSLNRKYVSKCENEVIAAFHNNFETHESDLRGFYDNVTQKGYAFCVELRGSRKNKNFLQSQIAAVDIDAGHLYEDVLRSEWVQKHAAFVYTTKNHKPDAHRLRITFALRTVITDADEYKSLLTGLIDKFGSDEACGDICHFFFGHRGGASHYIGKVLEDDEVVNLIARGEERMRIRSTRKKLERGAGVNLRSTNRLPHSLEVTTADGGRILAWDAQPGTRILCPKHIDTRPSAMVTRNRQGVPVIFCSRCASSFYFDGYKPDPGDSWFDYSWERLREVKIDHEEHGAILNVEQLRGIESIRKPFVDNDHATHALRPLSGRTSVLEELDPNLSGNDLTADPEIVLVKSDKGTGKTEWLQTEIGGLLEAGYRVLVISHRRSLIESMCKRLGLTSYQTVSDYYQQLPAAFAICLDSIHKLKTEQHKFDVVIFDESEQVFGHCVSDTFKALRRNVLVTLKHYIEVAKRLYLLDADLNRLSIDVVGEILKDKHRRYRTLINDWHPPRSVELYDDDKPHQLVGEMISSVDRGEKLFVCSNSKSDIDLLAVELQRHTKRKDLRIISVTSDNSQDPEIEAFIKDIAVEIRKYDVVLASPSISTGVDISFPGGERYIDSVFGIFRSMVTTHLEIDQQLRRVRNPGRTCVWIAPDEFLLETDPNIIRAEIQAAEEKHRVLLAIDEKTGERLYLQDGLYDHIYSVVNAMHRASKNSLKRRALEYLKWQNVAVTTAAKDTVLRDLGATVLREGKKSQQATLERRILEAEEISSERYLSHKQRVDSGEKLPSWQQAEMRRYELQSFYGCAPDADLIAFDDSGYGRKAVRNLELLYAGAAYLTEKERFESDFTTDKPQLLVRQQIARDLFRCAGLLGDNGVPTTTARICAPLLGRFLIKLEEQNVALQRHFDFTPRADAQRSPIKQLNEFLRLFGLKLSKVDRDQSGGKDIVIYSIDSTRMNVMVDHVVRRISSRK